jgi:hypothetical protein
MAKAQAYLECVKDELLLGERGSGVEWRRGCFAQVIAHGGLCVSDFTIDSEYESQVVSGGENGSGVGTIADG